MNGGDSLMKRCLVVLGILFRLFDALFALGYAI